MRRTVLVLVLVLASGCTALQSAGKLVLPLLCPGQEPCPGATVGPGPVAAVPAPVVSASVPTAAAPASTPHDFDELDPALLAVPNSCLGKPPIPSNFCTSTGTVNLGDVLAKLNAGDISVQTSGGGGTGAVNLTQILGAPVSATNPAYVAPSTGATFAVSNAGLTELAAAINASSEVVVAQPSWWDCATGSCEVSITGGTVATTNAALDAAATELAAALSVADGTATEFLALAGKNRSTGANQPLKTDASNGLMVRDGMLETMVNVVNQSAAGIYGFIMHGVDAAGNRQALAQGAGTAAHAARVIALPAVCAAEYTANDDALTVNADNQALTPGCSGGLCDLMKCKNLSLTVIVGVRPSSGGPLSFLGPLDEITYSIAGGTASCWFVTNAAPADVTATPPANARGCDY